MYRSSTLKSVFLLLELPIGIVYFVIAVTGLSLAVGLIPIIVGIPLLISMMGFSGIIFKFERNRSYFVLGELPPLDVQMEDFQNQNLFARLITSITKNDNWKGLLLMIVKLPLGILAFTFVVTLFSTSIGLLAYPVVRFILLNNINFDIYNTGLIALLPFKLDVMGTSLIYFALGALITYYSLSILNAFTYAYFRVIAAVTAI
jgi:hypothetical protein